MSVVEPIIASLEGRGSKEFRVEALEQILAPGWVEEVLGKTGSHSKRRRRLPATFMVWFLILMGIYRRVSYVNLLEKMHGTRWTGRTWGDGPPPTSHAVTEARDRLGVEPVSVLFELSADRWILAFPGRDIGGHRCFALDGVCMKVPDSAANRDHYGKPGSNRGKSAYPQMRSVMLVDVATHLVAAERHEPFRQGEMTLSRQILPDIRPGMLVIMDRNFHAYDFLWAIATQGAQFLVRVKPKKLKARAVVRLGPGDDIVSVRYSKPTRAKHPELPARMRLRRIRYRPPGGKEEIILLTTLLDPEAVTTQDLIDGYRNRWHGESAFDEIKTHLCDCATVNRPVVFRSQRPNRVEQEYYGLLIAFNVICMLKIEAAELQPDLEPGVISFAATTERLREALQEMLWLPIPLLLIRREKMFRAISRAKVPRRPGRSYPRAVKVKMSNYPLKREEVA